jgi:phosphoribosylformylglycinamidine synthase
MPPSARPLHLMHFEGGNALSAFRAQALLARLQAACPRITAWRRAMCTGWERRAAGPRGADKLAALLTYGDPTPARPGERWWW